MSTADVEHRINSHIPGGRIAREQCSTREESFKSMNPTGRRRVAYGAIIQLIVRFAARAGARGSGRKKWRHDPLQITAGRSIDTFWRSDPATGP